METDPEEFNGASGKGSPKLTQCPNILISYSLSALHLRLPHKHVHICMCVCTYIFMLLRVHIYGYLGVYKSNLYDFEVSFFNFSLMLKAEANKYLQQYSFRLYDHLESE